MVTGATGADGLAAESGYTDGFVTAGLLALGAAAVTVLSILVARRHVADVPTVGAMEVGAAGIGPTEVVTTPESPFAESEVEVEREDEIAPALT
jgi:hypothetical protein